MNEQQKQDELERRLEQATCFDPSNELDAEALAWRDRFLALGKLLEAGHDATQETLDRLLEIPGTTADKAVVRKDVPRTQRSWVKYAGVVSAAMVVSLMVALGILKYSPKIEPPPDEPLGSAVAKKLASPSRDPLAWDDNLDVRLARIEQQLLYAQYDSTALGYSFENVRSNLESLAKEVDQSSM
jgi:hypothetical protein